MDTRAGFTSLRLLILAVAASVFVVLTLLLAGPSSAQPVKDGKSTVMCPIEDEHGRTLYVEVGTRVGLFYCGEDGEWHLGLVQLDWSRSVAEQPASGGAEGVTSAALQEAEGRLRAGQAAP